MKVRLPLVLSVRALSLISLTIASVTCSACGGSAPPPAAPVASEAAAPPDPVFDAALKAAVASAERPAAETARDKYRHPRETLEFFGLRADMTVVELWPGNGWYTAILAPLLADKGKLVAATMAPNDPNAHGAKELAARVAAKPDVFGKVDMHAIHPPQDLSLGADGSADAVVTFRNFHNWMKDGIADKVVAASFRVLKPGGVLGVVDHRARPDADPAKLSDSGYVPEATVIDIARKAGFVLEARSEINANPLDTKDYPQGVWTLPPVLRLGEQDKAKYQAIGESDRMTLRFRKP
jgi:predicted methyltransferase